MEPPHYQSTSTVVEEDIHGINKISSFVTSTQMRHQLPPHGNRQQQYTLCNSRVMQNNNTEGSSTTMVNQKQQAMYFSQVEGVRNKDKIGVMDSTGGSGVPAYSLPASGATQKKSMMIRLNTNISQTSAIPQSETFYRLPISTKNSTTRALLHQPTPISSTLQQPDPHSAFLTNTQINRQSSITTKSFQQETLLHSGATGPVKASHNNTLVSNNSIYNTISVQTPKIAALSTTQLLLQANLQSQQMLHYATQAHNSTKQSTNVKSASNFKQGTQGSQGEPLNRSTNLVKVGTSVPKTSSSVRALTNLKQFNHLYSQKIQQQTIQQASRPSSLQIQPVKSFARKTSTDEAKQQSPRAKEESNTLDKSRSLQHLTLELKTGNSHLKSFVIGYQTNQITKQSANKIKSSNTLKKGRDSSAGSVSRLTVKPKSGGAKLRISIPSQSPKRLKITNLSPKSSQHEDEHSTSMNESTVISYSKKAESHAQLSLIPQPQQQSVSTKNSQGGNIKVNKLTCQSTRHNSQKPNMFGTIAQKEVKEKTTSVEPSTRGDGNALTTQDQSSFPLQPAHKIIIPNHEPTKHSLKRNGLVRAYAANTNQGLVRNYNEDRVSIILNILKPASRSDLPDKDWPRCSFFAIYDGHGGAACADFLRDNLHQYVINDASFPQDPKEAIRQAFALAETHFLERAVNEDGMIVDKSGSCAIVVIIVEEMCYIANVGDSRAVLSGEAGKKTIGLSRDHKPNDSLEKRRIVQAGGQIYHRTTAPSATLSNEKRDVVVGPMRVLPGRLSVSRTFGDVEAKLPQFGGNLSVVVATPEITSFKLVQSEHDFILLGCDGIFDKMSNEDVVTCVWNSVTDNHSLKFASNIHKQSGMAVEYILKNSLLRRTLDNVTVVMIAFNNFKQTVFGADKPQPEIVKERMRENKDTNENQENIQQNSKKENVPPPALKREESFEKPRVYYKPSNPLNIDTNQHSNIQAPKSTTNASLQFQHQQMPLKVAPSSTIQFGERKRSGGGIPVYNKQQVNGPRHFDFSHI